MKAFAAFGDARQGDKTTARQAQEPNAAALTGTTPKPDGAELPSMGERARGAYAAVAPEPIRPGAEERRANPRSTSAKLRWAVAPPAPGAP